jgi:hypothetical protein
MSDPIVVQIVGAPIACAEGVKDGWRHMARWAAGQLHNRFGDAVRVEYYDLFDPDCPQIPPDAQLPLVLVEGEVIDSGGKLPMPAIRRRLETILIKQPD